MSIQVYTQIFILLAGVSCMIFGALMINTIIGEINRKLPENEQISYFGGHRTKYHRIREEYRRLYPDGRLLFYSRVFSFAGIGFLLLLALGWRFGIFK
jgi:hypothetical protein